MKRFMNVFVEILGIVLILCFSGCTNQTEMVATSKDGVKISFQKSGAGKPAIIFVHGWGNTRNIWDDQVSYFSQNYTAIGIDLAGFGKSGNNRKEWTMSAFGDDVVAVINKLNLNQVVLVGFSMGGPIIVEAARKMPDKIIGLVLVDTMQDIERPISNEEMAYIDSVFMDLVNNPAPEKLENIFYKKNKEESFQRVLQMLEGSKKIGWRASLSETGKWMNSDCIGALKAINVPVIAINSDAQPTNEQAYREIIPTFSAHIMKDVGHVVFWDKPDEFNKLLEESVQDFL